MGVSILRGEDYACLYCDTEDRAFGPVMSGAKEARAFCEWLEHDPREYNPRLLLNKYRDWKADRR